MRYNMMTSKDAVNKLLTNVRERLATVGLDNPSDELVLQTAKELKLVFGKRGRDGGCFATDTGVATLGLDLASFRTVEAQDRELVRAERAKNKKTTESEVTQDGTV